MQFNEIADENGTKLKTYAELLQTKAKEAGLITVMAFVGKEGANKGLHVISSMDGSPARALIEVGKAMLAEPAEQQIITPVSPGLPN